MKHISLVISLLLVIAVPCAAAQDDKKPATGAAAQGSAQGQTAVTAGPAAANATGNAAATAGTEAGQASASVSQGTEISATLARPVDSGKAKPGDEVVAKASKDIKSGGTVVVPRGASLIGHVTRARSRSDSSAGGGAASELGIVFDRAVLKDGSVVMLNGAIAAIGSARSPGVSSSGAGAAGAGTMTGSTAGAGGGLTGSVGSTVGGVAGATTSATGNLGTTVSGAAGTTIRSTGAVGGFDASGSLQSGSRGVFGIRDCNLAADATGGAQGSVITSTGRNVRLESGTQMLLLAGARAGKQPAAAADAPEEKPRDTQ